MRGSCGSATGDPLCSLSSASAKRSASSTKNSSLSSKASKLQEALLSVARLLPTKTTTRSSSKSARLSRRSDSRRSSPPNITIIVNHRSASASPPRSSDLPGAPPSAATHAGAPPTRTAAPPPAAQLAANDLRRLLHQRRPSLSSPAPSRLPPPACPPPNPPAAVPPVVVLAPDNPSSTASVTQGRRRRDRRRIAAGLVGSAPRFPPLEFVSLPASPAPVGPGAGTPHGDRDAGALRATPAQPFINPGPGCLAPSLGQADPRTGVPPPSSAEIPTLGAGARPPLQTPSTDNLCSLLSLSQREFDAYADSITPPASPSERASSDMDTEESPPASFPVRRNPSAAAPRRSLAGPHRRCPYLPLSGPQPRPGVTLDRVLAVADGDRTLPSDVHELTRIQGLLRTTTVGGVLLHDVINVARALEPCPWPPPSRPPVPTGRPVGGDTMNPPARTAHGPSRHHWAQPAGPTPATVPAPAAPPGCPRPIPFRAILPSMARAPMPALPPSPSAQPPGDDGLSPCPVTEPADEDLEVELDLSPSPPHDPDPHSSWHPTSPTLSSAGCPTDSDSSPGDPDPPRARSEPPSSPSPPPHLAHARRTSPPAIGASRVTLVWRTVP